MASGGPRPHRNRRRRVNLFSVFESVVTDPAADALRRAATIFRVIAVLILIATALSLIMAVVGRGTAPVLALIFNVVLSGTVWVTAGGIEERKNWARWVGVVVGVLELINFPIGTVIGVAILVYLLRASRAGLFASAPERAA